MLILLFFIGLISLIFSVRSLMTFNKQEQPQQEKAFVFLLIGIACFGLWIAMYTFRLNIM